MPKSKFILGVTVLTAMISMNGVMHVSAQTKTQPQAQNCSVTTTLKMGSKGTEVSCLQSMLGLKADGVFGSATKDAVMNFQKMNGLPADGVVNSSTRTALETEPTTKEESSSPKSGSLQSSPSQGISSQNKTG